MPGPRTDERTPLSRSRWRPRHGTVVAYLALFLALGGTSYALTVTSRQIKNRSVRAIDVARNTLSGVEVNESRLSKVRTARRADTAGGADRAATAGTATRALSAGTADRATNADTLAGTAASDFVRSSRIASAGPVATTTASATLFTFPDLGLEVRTDADATAEGELTFVNTSTRELRVANTTLASGTPVVVPSVAGEIDAFVHERTTPGTAVLVRCGYDTPNLTCLAVRSR